jgi:hypothetical protein
MTGRDDAEGEDAGVPGAEGVPMDDWIAFLQRQDSIARLGGPQGLFGVLLCAALPVVPFGLLLAGVLGRLWAPLATSGVAVVVCVVLWALVVAWVFEGVRA